NHRGAPSADRTRVTDPPARGVPDRPIRPTSRRRNAPPPRDADGGFERLDAGRHRGPVSAPKSPHHSARASDEGRPVDEPTGAAAPERVRPRAIEWPGPAGASDPASWDPESSPALPPTEGLARQ